MRGLRHRHLAKWAALALFAAFSLVAAADAFDHTDDGCVVETHCLLCQWQHGATAVPTVLAKTPGVPVDLAFTVFEAASEPHLDGVRLETSPRGPPLS
jgi:hypothetical protein